MSKIQLGQYYLIYDAIYLILSKNVQLYPRMNVYNALVIKDMLPRSHRNFPHGIVKIHSFENSSVKLLSKDELFALL